MVQSKLMYGLTDLPESFSLNRTASNKSFCQLLSYSDVEEEDEVTLFLHVFSLDSNERPSFLDEYLPSSFEL